MILSLLKIQILMILSQMRDELVGRLLAHFHSSQSVTYADLAILDNNLAHLTTH